jgi:hypothetical protein
MGETIARFQISADVVIRDIAEGLMLVNVRTGDAWKLNQVGASVCRRLDGSTETATIVAELEQTYGVGADRLLRDIDALLGDLQKQGLIQRVTDR